MSTGNTPENTIGFTSLKPGNGASVGRASSVTVSPTFASASSLTFATSTPTSPAISFGIGVENGENTPSSWTSNVFLFDQSWIFCFSASVPSSTRTSITTPR